MVDNPPTSASDGQQDRMQGSAATVTLDREDVEAVVNLIERSIQMLRARWNVMPVNETDAFVRVRAAVDGRGR